MFSTTIRRGLIAAACTLALAVPALTGAAASAATHRGRPAATPACNFQCFDLSSLDPGLIGQFQSAYIPGSNGVAVKAKVGDKLDFRAGNDVFSNQDFSNDAVGTVSDYCSATPGVQQFPSTGYICQHYSGDTVYEADWSPYGVESGLCVGVAAPNVAGQNVTLRNCGQTTATMWIADADNGHLGADPWINGSDTQFSHPLVLQVLTNTKHPQNQLFVERMNLLTGGWVVNDQEFRVSFGAIP